MSRPLRIEYPGAWYHVMNRGRRHCDVFEEEQDFHLFIDILKNTSKIWNLKVSAYCLMSNHYHLLVQTPDGNLSRCMRHLNGVYTQRFNRRHDYDGQLFRGRYKAILVEEDHYLLELLRYIHCNPTKAGLVKSLDDYRWSSHHGYTADQQSWNWLHREPLLKMFSDARCKAFAEYRDFVCQEESEEIQHFFSLKNLPSILGSEHFINTIKETFGFLHKNLELSSREVLSVDGQAVIQAVCTVCNIDKEQLFAVRRGVVNVPKDLAMYVLRVHSQKTLKEIGTVLKCNRYSTVCTAISRFESMMEGDGAVREVYERVCREMRITQP